MSKAKTCDVCGSPVTQNEHGEVWHTRTDLVQSQIDAAVAAEREACAKMLNKYAAEKGSTKTPQGRTANFYARRIRARGDTDALAQRDARIRVEALREAAKTSEHFYEKGQVTKPSDILALIPEKEEDNG